MNKAVTRYIWIMAVVTMITAVFNSELTTILASGLFTVTALVFPGGVSAMAAGICIALYAFMSADIASGLILAAAFIVPALAMAASVKKSFGLETVLGVGTLTRAAALFGYDYYESLLGHTTVKELLTGFGSSELAEMLVQTGYKEAEIEKVKAMWETVGSLIPAVVITSAFVFSILSFAFAKRIIKKTGGKLLKIKDFTELKADRGFAFATLALAVITVFSSGTPAVVLMNALYFMYVIYLVCGAAAFVRLFKKLTGKGFSAALLTVALGVFTFGTVIAVGGFISSFTGKNKQKERN